MHACASMHTTHTYIHTNTLDWEILFLRNCALHAAKNCSVPTVFSNYGKVISGRMATLNNNNKGSPVDAATLHDFLLHLNFRHVKISERIMATAISICIMMLSTSFLCKQLDVLWLGRRDCFLWSFSALHELSWGLSVIDGPLFLRMSNILQKLASDSECVQRFIAEEAWRGDLSEAFLFIHSSFSPQKYSLSLDLSLSMLWGLNPATHKPPKCLPSWEWNYWSLLRELGTNLIRKG